MKCYYLSMKIKILNYIPWILMLLSLYIHYKHKIDAIQMRKPLQNHSKIAFATVASPAFCMGAVVLGHTLRKYHGDNYSYLCLVTYDVNERWKNILSQWWTVVPVREPKPHYWYRRSWMKLELWTFTEFEKLVYLDSDTIVTTSIGELFNEPELSCVPDSNPPQICNTGVLVLTPNMTTYNQMLLESGKPWMSHPPGDQGFINAFFKKFNPLPFNYNVPRLADSSFDEAYNDGSVKVVHFVCKKPWKCGREKVNDCGCGAFHLNQHWFDLWDEACKDHECWESWKE